MMAPFQSPKAADSSATSSSSASSSSLCQLEPTSSSASSPPSSSLPTKSKPENERNDLAPTSIHSKLSHSDSNLFDRFCSSLNLISKKKSLTLDNRLTKKTNKCSDSKLNSSSSSTSLSLKKPKIQQQKLFDENQGCVGGSSDNSNLIEDVKPIDTTSQVLKTSLSATCLKQDSLMSSVEKLNQCDEQKQQPQSHKSRPNRSKSSSPKSASLSWLSFINCCITRTDSLSDIGKVRTAEATTTTTNLKNGAKCSKPSSSSSSCLSQTLSKKPQINNNGRIPMKLFVNYDLPCSSSSSSSQFSDMALSSDSSSLPPVNCSSSNQLISSNLNNNNNNSSDTAIAGSSSASVIITGSRSISSQTFCSTPSSSSRNGSGSGLSGVPHQPFRRRIHHNDNGDEQLLDPTVDIQVDDIHYQQYEQEQQQQLQRRQQLRASNEQNNDDDDGGDGDELMPLADIEEDFQKFLLQFNAFRNGSNDDGDDNGFHNINSQLHFQQPSGMAEIITGHHYPYRILNSNVTNPSQVNNSQQSSSSTTTTAAAGNSDGNMPKNFAELDRQSDQLLKRYKNPIHTQIDYVNCLVPDLMAISNCSFYWGKMDRYEAERLLENKPEGTFLLRDSAQEDHLFSVSFRRFDRSLHARIEQWKHRFSFDSHDPGVFSSTTVTGLIEHYKDPSHCMFFEPMLTRPLNRTEPFSLQHLARVTISDRCTYETVNQLPIPIVLKCYLKEYHYRQKVRTKHFDEITYLDDFFYN